MGTTAETPTFTGPNHYLRQIGFSVAERYLMPPLKTTVTKLSLKLVNRDIVIKVSRLGKTAGAIGASLLAKSRLLNKNL